MPKAHKPAPNHPWRKFQIRQTEEDVQEKLDQYRRNARKWSKVKGGTYPHNTLVLSDLSNNK